MYSARPIDTKTKREREREREAVTVSYMSVPMHKLSSIDAAYGVWYGAADSACDALRLF